MNTTKNSIARFSTAAAIAVIFTVSACGTDQAPPAQSPAQSVTVERQFPAHQMNRPNPIDPQPAQKTAQQDGPFMHGQGRPE